MQIHYILTRQGDVKQSERLVYTLPEFAINGYEVWEKNSCKKCIYKRW